MFIRVDASASRRLSGKTTHVHTSFTSVLKPAIHYKFGLDFVVAGKKNKHIIKE